jgi:hypothetical protein
MKHLYKRTIDSMYAEPGTPRDSTASSPPPYDSSSYDDSWVPEETHRAQTPKPGLSKKDLAFTPPREHSPFKPLPALPPFPPLRPPYRSKPPIPAEAISEWIDESDDSENESETQTGTWPSETMISGGTWRTDTRTSETSNETMVPSATSPLPPQPRDTIFRITGTDDELLARRPPTVPYEKRQSERRMEAKKHDQWRKRVANALCL